MFLIFFQLASVIFPCFLCSTHGGILVTQRIAWVRNASRELTQDDGQLFNMMAESFAEEYDARATKINPKADKVRRWLFKTSVVKSLLEVTAGGGLNKLEPVHRARLLLQTEEQYRQMMALGEFPPASARYACMLGCFYA